MNFQYTSNSIYIHLKNPRKNISVISVISVGHNKNFCFARLCRFVPLGQRTKNDLCDIINISMWTEKNL